MVVRAWVVGGSGAWRLPDTRIDAHGMRSVGRWVVGDRVRAWVSGGDSGGGDIAGYSHGGV